MRIDSDIDIDLGDRDKLLAVIKHVPAAMRNVDLFANILAGYTLLIYPTIR